MSIIKNKPDYLILHVETNDAAAISSRKIVDDSLMLKTNISKQLPNCRIVLSKPTIPHDHGKANLTIRNVNKQLECIDNNNINAEILEQKGLHFSRYFSRSAELVPPNKLGPPSLIGENLKKLRKLLLNHVQCIEIYWMTKNLDRSNF